MFKLVSFNTNGIRARQHQLEKLVADHAPDVIGIQESKVADDQFPLEAMQSLGYHAEFFGQKTHYGVCLLSKQPPLKVQKGFDTDTPDDQKRLISATYQLANGKELVVINGYFPQGENVSHEIKFPAKRKFYADLLTHLETHHQNTDLLAVMGDLNISATDLDIGIGDKNRVRWLKTGKTSFQPEEREWLSKLYSWGLVDSYRELFPESNELYSWFDYRSKGFDDEPKRGLRIDAIMVTPALMQHCTEAGIDYEIRGMEKPSDHAPIWSTFDL